MIFVEPACSEQDIVVTTSAHCLCIRAFISIFARAITATFVHGYQLFSLRSRNAF